MSLIGLVIFVLLACLVYWAVQYLMKTFEVPAKAQAVVTVLFVLVFVVSLLQALGLLSMSTGPMLRVR